MEILEELYKSFNIDYKTDISKISVKGFPVMKDLYDVLEKKSREEGKHEKEIEELRAVIRGLAIGNNSEIFNRIYHY